MKYRALLHQFILAATGAVALAGSAHGQSVVGTSWVETILVGTDIFETDSGSPLFSSAGVGYTDWLSPIIAGDLETDPALPAQVQSTASLVPEVSEYQFLTQQLGGGAHNTPTYPNPEDYIVLGGTASLGATGDLVTDLASALEVAGGPGYSLVSETPTTVGSYSYTTGAFEPDGTTLLEGDVTFDVYDLDLVEQPAAAVPEPSSLALLGVGLATLMSFARRRPGGGGSR